MVLLLPTVDISEASVATFSTGEVGNKAFRLCFAPGSPGEPNWLQKEQETATYLRKNPNNCFGSFVE